MFKGKQWKKVSVGEVAKVLRGASPRPKGDPRYYGGSVPRLMVADVTRDGRYVTPRIDFLTHEGAKLSRPMPAGTLTIVCSGDVGTPSFLAVDACIHDGFLAVDEIKSDVLPDYLYEVFLSLKTKLERSATHGGVFTNLTTDILREFSFLLPPLEEQKKITEVLRTWDEAIERLEVLREAKAHRLEGLVARMVHGAQAELQHLREHVNEISERNRNGKVERVLSVTNSTGFVLAEKQFAHRVASADLSNYKIVRQGQYAYNPSRINVGSIARLDGWRSGALSPMYVVFEVREGLDSDYFSHWLRSAEARQRIALSAQGSVRETVSFGDFSSILIPMPSFERQRQIAQTLNLVCDEIALIEAEIDALQRQKRGLMQKLLTGEWCVSADSQTKEAM